MIDRAFEKAVGILKEKRAILDKAAAELLQKETLGVDELTRLVGCFDQSRGVPGIADISRTNGT